MSRLELLLQKRIVAAVIDKGGMARVLMQTPFTVVGDPDIYGVWKGRMFLFEVKEGMEMPTIIQECRLQEWEKAGAHVAVVRSKAEALRCLPR